MNTDENTAASPRSRTELEDLVELAGSNETVSGAIVTRLDQILGRIKGPTPTEVEKDSAGPCVGTLGILSDTLHGTQSNLNKAEDAISRIEGLV